MVSSSLDCIHHMHRNEASTAPRATGFLVLDIETRGLFTSGFDSPPDVICAATLELYGTAEAGSYEWRPIKSWPVELNTMAEVQPEVEPRAMNVDEICAMIMFMWERCGWPMGRTVHSTAGLEHMNLQRLRVCGWNALGFDLKVLAAHCTRADTPQSRQCLFYLKHMAWDCCDPMFNFFMCKGFPIKLSAVAEALENPVSKTANGAEVASQWFNGTNRDRLLVLQYCENDVKMTANVLSALDSKSNLPWVTKCGLTRSWEPPTGKTGILAPVHTSSTWKFPDNSWMLKGKTPWKQPRAVEHLASKVIRQNQTLTEVSSVQSEQEVTQMDLPHPKNYIEWLRSDPIRSNMSMY